MTCRSIIAFLCIFGTTGISSAQIVESDDRTSQELRADLAKGQLEVCRRLGKMSIDLIDSRQELPDFQIMFDDLLNQVEPDSLPRSTLLFAMEVIAGQPLIRNEATLEAWKVRVYGDTFEFCLNETDKRRL